MSLVTSLYHMIDSLRFQKEKAEAERDRLRAEVAEMRFQKDSYFDQCDETWLDLEEVKAERDRLRKALAWYANSAHYHNTGYTVMDDKGERARKALKGKDNE